MFKLMLKIIGLIIAAGLLIFGAIYLTCGYQVNLLVKDLEKPLMEMPIDLSVPGYYQKSLPPVRAYFHGLRLEANLEATEPNELVIEEFFNGLKGSAVISDPNGELIASMEVNGGVYFYGHEAGHLRVIFLENFREFESAESIFRLQVDSGASGLKGVRQTLSLHYNLCGCEQSARDISVMLGIVFSLVGLAIAIPVCLSFRRRKKAVQSTSEEEAH